MPSYSDITLWRKFHRFAWKPWSAYFEGNDAGHDFAYEYDAWTQRGAMRKARAMRNALMAAGCTDA